MIELHMAPAAHGERNSLAVVMDVKQMKELSRELRTLIDSRISDQDIKVVKLFGVVRNP